MDLHNSEELNPDSSQSSTPKPAAAKPKAKPRPWRLQAKRLYLTYPQCATTKEEVLSSLQDRFGDQLKWYIICEEQHLDGTPHLHLALELNDTYSSRRPNDLDSLVKSPGLPNGKHGNYQAMKNMKKCVEYVSKAGNFISHGLNLDALKAKKRSRNESPAVDEILAGKTPRDILQSDPQTYFFQRGKILDFYADVQLLNASKRELPEVVNFKVTCNLTADESSRQSLEQWLNSNLLPDARKARKFRQPHLYLCGPPGIGKTTLLNKISEVLRIYQPPAEKWYDEYDDGLFDLIYFDEFKGTKPIGEMNLLTDGYPTPLIRRGKNPVLKKDILPVMIASNYLLADQFPNVKDVTKTAFVSRYQEIEFLDKFNVEIETKPLDPPSPIPDPPPSPLLLPTSEEEKEEEKRIETESEDEEQQRKRRKLMDSDEEFIQSD